MVVTAAKDDLMVDLSWAGSPFRVLGYSLVYGKNSNVGSWHNRRQRWSDLGAHPACKILQAAGIEP
jgi:hypothetical protein